MYTQRSPSRRVFAEIDHIERHFIENISITSLSLKIIINVLGELTCQDFVFFWKETP